MARRNPFPGVSRIMDRHGKARFRFRRKGLSCYLPGPYGSVEFRAAYEAACEGAKGPTQRSAPHGTLKWLVEQYIRSARYRDRSDVSRRVIRRELDWLCEQAGDLPYARLETRHVDALMAKKTGPSAANKVKKNLSLLFNFAIRKGFGVTFNPARFADRMKESEDGFHTWSEDEMEQFLSYFGPGTKARLVFLLALNTGASRKDLSRLTWGNIRGGRINYSRGKTNVGGDYPILPELAAELALLPRDVMVLIHHGEGLPYKPETLGNRFKAWAIAAGIPHCTLHGIRKGQATRIVNFGGTPDEVMAYLAHKTNAEGITYTKKANRGRLADSGLAKISGANPEQKLSNLSAKLDKTNGK